MVEVEIARARVAQAQARLDKMLLDQQQAQINSPFAAVVVEGDRRDLSGMPVRQGERVSRLARVEGLCAVLHLPQRHGRYPSVNASGELRLLSEPDRNISFVVESNVPEAKFKAQPGIHL